MLKREFMKILVKPEEMNDFEFGFGYSSTAFKTDHEFYYMDFKMKL